MRIHRQSRASAFTLVEVLIALGILGIIIAAIYSSWTAILRSSKVGLEAAASVQRSRAAVRTLEESLNSARSFAADLEYYTFLAENGAEASLSFVARLPESFPRSGKFGDFDVRRVTFSVEPGPESGKQLVLRQNPILMELDKDEEEHPLVLAKNVKEFSLEFWDARTGDWIDEWTTTNQMPGLVKIKLQLENNDPRLSRPVADEPVTRIVALSSVMVQPGWQTPVMQGGGPLGGQTNRLGLPPRGIQNPPPGQLTPGMRR
jgi:type II secretion system protein J